MGKPAKRFVLVFQPAHVSTILYFVAGRTNEKNFKKF